MISYHFAGKDDLIREMTLDVLARGEAFMLPRASWPRHPARACCAFTFESNLAFMQENRNNLLAFRDIFLNARGDDGSPLFEEKSLDRLVTSLRQLLAHFQVAGDFRRDFDPEVMALAIRAS